MDFHRSNKVSYIAKVGILSSIAAVLMAIDVPLWFAPGFYQLDFSEVVVFIGSFALGPGAGVLIELFKNLLKAIIFTSSTAYVGEFANFVTGCALVVPAALIYKKRHTRFGAIIGIICGTVCLAIAGALMNYYILVPTFSKLYNLPMETIIGMGTAVNAKITDLRTMILFAVVPFNLLKGVLCGILTMLLYKHLSVLLKK